MTPIPIFARTREKVLDAYERITSWRHGASLVDRVQIDKAMSENTFRTGFEPFAETCNFFNDGLNKLHNG